MMPLICNCPECLAARSATRPSRDEPNSRVLDFDKAAPTGARNEQAVGEERLYRVSGSIYEGMEASIYTGSVRHGPTVAHCPTYAAAQELADAANTALRAKPADEGLRELLREARDALHYAPIRNERSKACVRRIDAALEHSK